jgi:wobble nucleotide-excising tRNase
MKIKKIQSINFGTFKSFQWTVPEFHDRVNVLLGWNGCGKTIISRILRSFEKGIIENGSRIDGATFTIGFDNGSKKQDELSGYENKIRVFNEDYIKEIIDQTHLKYVAIGTTEVDFSKKQKELDDAKGELSKLPQCKNEYDDISKRIGNYIKYIQGISNIKIENSSSVYNNYDKSYFEKRVDWLKKQIEQGKQLENFVQSGDELKNLLATLSNLSEKEREYKILKKWNDWVAEKLEKINKYLKFSPVYEKSVRLSSYPDGGKEEDWIRSGLDLHKLSNESEQLIACLFCGSKIQNRDELLKHFSNDVIELNNALDAMGKSAEDALREVINCKTFYALEKTNLETFFTSLQEKIKSKKENKIKEVNACEFNNLFINEEVFKVDKTAWTVEIHYVATEYQKYLDKKKVYEDCLKSRVDKNNEIKKIEQELKELKKKAKNVQIPADRINKLLASTFPYKKIELDDSTEEVGYILKRDGVECSLDSLSEGERNFLALAYFLLSINDGEEEGDEEA